MEPTNAFNRILVIDDNLAIHADFRKVFEVCESDAELDELDAALFGGEASSHSTAPDFELGFACQGKEGLDLLIRESEAGRPFFMAFVDMRMPPGWDGVETIERLWQHDPDLQVVICTAFSDRSWDEIFDRLGQCDRLLILKKPFDDVEIIQLASSLCKKRKLLAESKARFDSLQEVVQIQGAELRVAHKDAEVLIDSISSALVSMDENGLVSRWNPVAESLFGIPLMNAIGKRFSELNIGWVDWPSVSTALRNCTVIQQKQLEVQFVDQQGALKTLSATMCPILNDPTSKARLMLASDVTMQKALQSQLDQSQRLESVGQLAAGVAHEINTPMQYIGDNVRFAAKAIQNLSPLLDCLYLLADSETPDEQVSEARKKALGAIKPAKLRSLLSQVPDALSDSIEGVEAVAKIVAAMKEFSHPGTDEKSMVCVNHVLESTITVARNEWKYIAEMQTDFDPELVEIDALPSELNQAFLNLIVNASHAIGDRVEAGDYKKGEIRVKTTSSDDCVVVTIQDNGGGIPRAVRERVFEPFFTTKPVGKGTGQGLPIAFNVITKKHAGRMSFQVEEGVGTTFKIELPIGAVGTRRSKQVASTISPILGSTDAGLVGNPAQHRFS